jgi:hypothetical protein
MSVVCKVRLTAVTKGNQFSGLVKRVENDPWASILYLVPSQTDEYHRTIPRDKMDRESSAMLSSVGPYALDAGIEDLDNVIEISPIEYQALPTFFEDEKIYRTPDISFLGLSWNVLIAATRGRIYKISPQLIAENSADADRAYSIVCGHFQHLMGKPTEEDEVRLLWRRSRGNVILERQRFGTDYCVQFFLTSGRPLQFRSAGHKDKAILGAELQQSIASIPSQSPERSSNSVGGLRQLRYLPALVLWGAIIGAIGWFGVHFVRQKIANIDNERAEQSRQDLRLDQTKQKISALAASNGAVRDWKKEICTEDSRAPILTSDLQEALPKAEGRPILVSGELQDMVEQQGNYTLVFDAMLCRDSRLRLEVAANFEQASEISHHKDDKTQYYALVIQVTSVERKPKMLAEQDPLSDRIFVIRGRCSRILYTGIDGELLTLDEELLQH